MKFENQPKGFNKKQYIEVCHQLWGCVPVDVSWVMETNAYKSFEKK
jgi:hypothetical protein